MSHIKEFYITVPQAKLDKLMKKLELTDFPSELENAPEWQYGTPLWVANLNSTSWRRKPHSFSDADCMAVPTSNVLPITGSTSLTGAPKKSS